MSKYSVMLSLVALVAGNSVHAQQVNVIVNNQWPAMFGEIQQQPRIVFQSSFQTASGQGFATPWFGATPFCLSVSENPFFFSLDAQIVTPEDVRQNRRGSVLFSLPRDLQAAAQILQASNWRFRYSMDGYHLDLAIESIWLDAHMVPRCKGHVVVTADPEIAFSREAPTGLTDEQINQLERLADLRDRGILTEEEFSREKQRVLPY